MASAGGNYAAPTGGTIDLDGFWDGPLIIFSMPNTSPQLLLLWFIIRHDPLFSFWNFTLIFGRTEQLRNNCILDYACLSTALWNGNISPDAQVVRPDLKHGMRCAVSLSEGEAYRGPDQRRLCFTRCSTKNPCFFMMKSHSAPTHASK